MTIKQFQKITRSERTALAYLRTVCWPDGEISCQKCGSEKVYSIQNNRYRCSSCKYSFHDLTGRWFGLLRLPPTQLLWLTKLFELEITALECSKQLGTSYPTAAKAFSLFRLSTVGDSHGVFAGCRVEVDEAYFGAKKKGKRGRGSVGKVAVFGIKSRDGKARMEILEDVSSGSLLNSIERNVEKGSMIYSDKFRAYNDLRATGYKHRTINHRKWFVNGITHTNGVEGLWGYVKEGLIKHHGVSRKNFPLYLAE